MRQGRQLLLQEDWIGSIMRSERLDHLVGRVFELLSVSLCALPVLLYEIDDSAEIRDFVTKFEEVGL
jgi:hypothetical protein